VPSLRLYFLGPLKIRCGERQLPAPPTLKSQSLLAYLILHRDQPQPRDRLATLFWGDRPERRARRSLSTALWHIRRCLPDDGRILSDLYTVQFDPRAALWLDVDEFRSLVSLDDIASLQSAVELYRGGFLDGFYDDWIVNERYRLEASYLEALARLTAGHEGEGNHEKALAAARRRLDHDPLREDAHRAVMRAYCQLGRRNAALGQYDRCREVMLEELGVEPMAETTGLYRAILKGRLVGVGTPTAEMETPTAGIETPTAGIETRPTPVGRSPLDVAASTPLVGREQELASLHRCWREAQATQGKLVLVSGEAGVGKSRLIEEFADRLRWQGVRVLWGRCYEFERVLPYQPVAEALRAALPTLGSDDLVLGSSGCGNPPAICDSLILLNNGTGRFSHLDNAIPAKPFGETDVALEIDADDINGDGYQDLFIVFTKENYVGRTIQILINNQDGTFRDETSTRLPQPDNNDPWIIWLYLLDLDMDGHLDIVAAPMGDPQGPMFYLYNGDGTYSPLPNVFNIAPDNTFTFLDVDRDGFLDVHWAWGGGIDPEWHHLVHALGCPVFLPLACHNHPAGN